MKKKIGSYQIRNSIGQGTFGLVKEGIHLPTSERVAIKILEKSKIIDDKDIKNIIQQLSILKKTNHRNVLRLYELIETEKKIYIVTEYIEGGELYQSIITKGKIDEKLAKKYFRQIIDGIKYLHENGIVHRDLKPQNIIIDNNHTLKIIDFGLGRQYEEGQKLKTSCGSPCYAAPQMVSGAKYVPLMTDIWSSGIILYAMLAGYLPFEDANYKVLYSKVLKGKYKTPEWISEDAKHLLSGIINVNPKQRFTIQDILSHPWLRNTEDLSYIQHQRSVRQMAYPLVQRALNITMEQIIENISKNNQSQIQTYLHLLMKQIGKRYRNRSQTTLGQRKTSNRKRIISQVHSKNPGLKQPQHKGLIQLNYLFEGSENEVKRQITQNMSKQNVVFRSHKCMINNKQLSLNRLVEGLFYLQVPYQK